MTPVPDRVKALVDPCYANALQTGEGANEPRGQLALLTIDKTCIQCRVPQPESAYYAEAASPDGLQAICMTCSKERARIWYMERAGERIAANRQWRHDNPEKARQLSRRQLRRRRLGRDREALEWSYIVLGDPCAYCGAPAEHVDHIEAVARGGSNQWGNLTGACAACNSAKCDGSVLRFLLQRVDPSVASHRQVAA